MGNQTIKQVGGPVDRVPCAWCGQTNDYRDLIAQNMINDNEAQVDCDHCGRINQVVQIQPVTVVKQIQSPRNNEILQRRASRKAGPGPGVLVRRRTK